ncbi:helix-turn-helix domain-containing protein [Butyrivibrio sp. INlla14]|uniref:helix-turn-helix domain-containing protein n=1 Tax=Butyrivibrio sp. INlla14 TaxID=1520808 RepID=UPI0008761BBC|nr:helix-turn-helix domain-containing protein [Butyrivibrio sp. INlla14]SCY74673.1 DNA-binding transcriptional regulator, XRE-family HTH domain [Butyrivibrio sp. INlla14]
MKISERIFTRLKEMGMTEASFARQIGASRSTVSDWKNKNQNPSSDRIMKICEVLEMTPEELLAGTEHTKAKTKKKVFTEKEKELVQVYDDVSESTKKRLLEYAKRLRRMENNGEI